ncbi:YigZ family protein [Erysipelothrix inopinata]|uniref:YigZ family protein n=1 Tax=Erysipelothrix inopinata TaxID=225084 RepID=A0A7G9S0I4_9FIRM|nr:YigZ family protein [Erysipelothrix inopinata]QNN61359.1 YigZ family protein [Erysipelothrix inopinata]
MTYKETITIKDEVVTQQEIKKSKFITYLMPVETEDEAKDYLKLVKKMHPKATHHCSAYIVKGIERSNDDGEPASSAGLPMLEVLRGNRMEGVIAVVVRYFGGTELGVGGLIRAYGSSVTLGIQEAEILRPQIIYIYVLKFDYQYTNDVENFLASIGTVENREYTDRAEYTVYLQDESTIKELEDITRGTIIINKEGERIELVGGNHGN